MAEKEIVKIEVKFDFHVGEVPNDPRARFICVENEKGERYLYEAEWIGDLWEVPSHQYCLELWEGERVLGWAKDPRVEITYK